MNRVWDTNLKCQQTIDFNFSFSPMKAMNLLIFIVEKGKKNANIGSRENFDLEEAYALICHLEIVEKLRRSFLNILNILNKNGMRLNGSTMKRYHDVRDLYFNDDEMSVTIDGQTRRFALSEISPALQKASVEARNMYEISPSGYGIHWPLIDEDLSIDGLLGIVHSPQKILTGTQYV